MQGEHRPVGEPYWTQISDRDWGLVVDGRIEGLVYWTEAGVSELGGPSGEPVVTDPAWFWLSVDDPDNHYELGGVGIPSHDMSDEELIASRDDALAAAEREILSQRKHR